MNDFLPKTKQNNSGMTRLQVCGLSVDNKVEMLISQLAAGCT